MGEVNQAPGFFGKLPSHGDFVSRRLPPAVRDCFDHWLQGALLQSRSDLGEAWQPTWLSSPLWRFVVGAGVCGEQAWAGVMMPSHDQVGRCFPLLLAAPVDGIPSLRECVTLHDSWFEGLEDLALSTLEEGFSLEAFEAAAAAAGSMPAGNASSVGAFAVPDGGIVARRTGALLPALADAAMTGTSAWWTDGSPRLASCLAVCCGLPKQAAFASLLDGRWQAYGWREV